MLRGLIRTSGIPNTFFTVLIGFIFAVFLVEGYFSPEALLSLIFVIIVLSIFWQGNYLLNDYFDLDHDRKDPKKKNRVLASGRVSPKKGLAISLLIIFTTLIILYLFDELIFLFAVIMFLLMIIYCVKPYRLKEKYPVNIILGGPVNHFFRFLSGWIVVAPLNLEALLMALLMTSISIIVYIFYRIQNGGVHFRKAGINALRGSFILTVIMTLIYAYLGIFNFIVLIIPFAVIVYYKLEKLLETDMKESDIRDYSIRYCTFLLAIFVAIILIFSFL